jgi:hypothetical protein
MSLEVIVLQRGPIDLSNEVTLEVDMPVAHGGFGYVGLGRLNGELVS